MKNKNVPLSTTLHDDYDWKDQINDQIITVQHYFKKYGGCKTEFTNMLQMKINFCSDGDKKVFAYDGMKSKNELSQMLEIADIKL